MACTWKKDYSLTISSSDTGYTGAGIWKYAVDWENNGKENQDVASPFVPWNNYSSCNNRFRAYDKAGNVSGWSTACHIHMDTQAPWVTNWEYGTIADGKVKLFITAADNQGVTSVKAPTSTEKGGYSNWHWYECTKNNSTGKWEVTIDGATFNQWNTKFRTHLYVYDRTGNSSCTSLEGREVLLKSPTLEVCSSSSGCLYQKYSGSGYALGTNHPDVGIPVSGPVSWTSGDRSNYLILLLPDSDYSYCIMDYTLGNPRNGR